MSLNITNVRMQVIEEINLLPAERLVDLYQLIHYFRVGVEQSQELQQPHAKVMALAGSWSALTEEG